MLEFAVQNYTKISNRKLFVIKKFLKSTNKYAATLGGLRRKMKLMRGEKYTFIAHA